MSSPTAWSETQAEFRAVASEEADRLQREKMRWTLASPLAPKARRKAKAAPLLEQLDERQETLW
jgi:hypothetical protein